MLTKPISIYCQILEIFVSLTDSLGGGFSLDSGVQGVRWYCADLMAHPWASPQPPREPQASFFDTPIEDRGSYPSRTRILGGVRPGSSIGVSKSRVPGVPRPIVEPPGRPSWSIHCAAAGAFIVPRQEHSLCRDGGALWEAPGSYFRPILVTILVIWLGYSFLATSYSPIPFKSTQDG